MITWLWPWLALLLPLPLLVQRFWPAAQSAEPALRVPFFQRWQALAQRQARRGGTGNRTTLLLLWLLWLCLLLAAARPIWIGDPVELPKSGRDLMLAVDLSGSMRVEDMQVGNNLVRRIDAVRTVGADFIGRRQGDRVGLILFGSNAYVQSPLTFDVATVEQFLLDAQIGFAGQETAIGDAIGLAVKRLRERPAESRVLVLLTDGQDTASTIGTMDAARLAQGLGIRIYTIGIGADQLALPGLFGSSFGSRQVNPSSDMDEAALQEIADSTGGRYFRARDPQELAGIYQLLDELEPIEQEAATYRPRRALGHWPLLLALLLSFALAWQRLERQPAATASSAEGSHGHA